MLLALFYIWCLFLVSFFAAVSCWRVMAVQSNCSNFLCLVFFSGSPYYQRTLSAHLNLPCIAWKIHPVAMFVNCRCVNSISYEICRNICGTSSYRIQIPSFSSLLIVAVKLKVKRKSMHGRHVDLHSTNCLSDVACFWWIYCHTSFEDPTLIALVSLHFKSSWVSHVGITVVRLSH